MITRENLKEALERGVDVARKAYDDAQENLRFFEDKVSNHKSDDYELTRLKRLLQLANEGVTKAEKALEMAESALKLRRDNPDNEKLSFEEVMYVSLFARGDIGRDDRTYSMTERYTRVNSYAESEDKTSIEIKTYTMGDIFLGDIVMSDWSDASHFGPHGDAESEEREVTWREGDWWEFLDEAEVSHTENIVFAEVHARKGEWMIGDSLSKIHTDGIKQNNGTGKRYYIPVTREEYDLARLYQLPKDSVLFPEVKMQKRTVTPIEMIKTEEETGLTERKMNPIKRFFAWLKSKGKDDITH